ncbi:MAG TPA: CAP domain-containing protein [Patescibacteria group bacterium]|nr:CAP domain-containing protein [Patescibacteria group bacterium]
MIDFLHHLLLPRESNNHRAKLLHHSSILILVVGLFLAGNWFAMPRHNQAVLGISYSINTQDLLILTNQERQQNGLSPLVMNDELTQAATKKAQDMFSKDYWAHIAPDGTTPWYFIRSSGYEYIYAGENLARGFTSTSDVINAWMASPSHRENVLSPNYKDVGFAIQEGTLTGEDTVLVVEEFGSTTRTTTNTVAQAAPQQPTPTPSSTIVQVPSPTPTPLPAPLVVTSPTPDQSQQQVAAFQNDPLINKPQAQKDIALIILLGLLVLLTIDIMITKRKHVLRVLSHNIDHIIFFGMLLLLVILITKGGVL